MSSANKKFPPNNSDIQSRATEKGNPDEKNGSNVKIELPVDDGDRRTKRNRENSGNGFEKRIHESEF